MKLDDSRIIGLKLHVGCGDIYLTEYVNCDAVGTLIESGQNNPNETMIGKYFARYPFGTPPRPFLIDKQFNALESWPFEDRSVKQVVTISFIEHFSQSDALFIISEIERVVKPYGRWIVDFPDVAQTVKRYYRSDPDFCMRLLYCNHKNQYSIHHWGYTIQSFKNLLTERGTWRRIVRQTVVTHDYPMIGCIAIRSNS